MGSYDYMFSDMDYEALAVVGGVIVVVALIALVIGVVSYILSAAGIYAIAKRRGINNAWMAWIPVANGWILGSISDQYQYVVKGKVRYNRIILVALWGATALLSGIYSGTTQLFMDGAANVLGILVDSSAALSVLPTLCSILLRCTTCTAPAIPTTVCCSWC